MKLDTHRKINNFGAFSAIGCFMAGGLFLQLGLPFGWAFLFLGLAIANDYTTHITITRKQYENDKITPP